jgi:UDP-2,3-diacylglucosamine pyrophosphatase LpxH
MVERVESIFISDVHLGSKGSNADLLLKTLKKYKFKNLIIVGDFIDGWLLKRRHHWPGSHTKVLKRILKLSKGKTKVFYITGNHDEFLREYGRIEFGNIVVCDELVYKDFFVTHGDLYDPIIKNGRLISILGSWGYEITLILNKLQNKVRLFFGLRPYSFSKFIKNSVKEASVFIGNFEKTLSEAAQKKGCSGVICGHIHTPEDKFINGIRYLNCGDWIENNSYIVEIENKFEIRHHEDL